MGTVCLLLLKEDRDTKYCHFLFCGMVIVMVVGCQPWHSHRIEPREQTKHSTQAVLSSGTRLRPSLLSALVTSVTASCRAADRCTAEELRDFSIFRRLMWRSIRQTHSLLEPLALHVCGCGKRLPRENRLLVNVRLSGVDSSDSSRNPAPLGSLRD